METIIIIIIMGQVKRYYANWKFGSVQIEIAGLPLNAIQMVCFGVWMETHTISWKKNIYRSVGFSVLVRQRIFTSPGW